MFGTTVVQRIVLTLYIKCSNPESFHGRKFLQGCRDLCRLIHRLFHLFKQAQLTLRFLLRLQRIKYRFRIRHRYRRSQQFFLLCIGSHRRFRDQPQTDFFLFLGLFYKIQEFFFLLNDPKALCNFCVCGSSILLESAEQIFKFQTLAQSIRFRCIESFGFCLIVIQSQITICLDRSQCLTQFCQILVFYQRLPNTFFRDFLYVGINIIQ